MSDFTIRPFEPADWPAAWELWRRELPGSHDASWDEARTASFLARNPGLSFAALRDGILVGTVMAGHDGRRGYVYHLAVAADCRGRGAGRALLGAAGDALAAAGIGKFHLFVQRANGKAEGFYERMDMVRRDDLTVWSRAIRE